MAAAKSWNERDKQEVSDKQYNKCDNPCPLWMSLQKILTKWYLPVPLKHGVMLLCDSAQHFGTML